MGFKTALVASALALAPLGSVAQLVFTDTGDAIFSATFNPAGGAFASGAFTSGDFGFFTATSSGLFRLTYLGQESGYSDGITIVVNGQTITESNAFGTSIIGPRVASTLLDFKFFSSGGDDVSNGGPITGHSTFALLGTNVTTNYGTFDYVIGYNDSVIHDDWDDFVVGVSAIPEPSTYAMLLAGLCGIAFALRRRMQP